jgi:tRNA(Ile)-lysidine synthase
MNDQAETFLMNLIRGSGIEGLGGMKPVRNLRSEEKSQIPNPKSQIKLVRPLLNWAKRADTENFCHHNKILYCSDAMNEDLRFQRVRIRKVLLPLLKDFNPKIVENLAAAAELLRGEIAGKLEPENIFSDEALALKDLRNLPKPKLYRTLRAWLENKRGDLRRLELKHIQAIERLAFSRKSGRAVELPGGEAVFKSEGKLQFQKTKVEK